MRALNLEHPDIERIILVSEASDRGNDNLDVWVHLRNGRRVSFTVFAIRNLQLFLQKEPTFVSPGMLVVAELSDELIVRVILQAWSLGIEHFGVLQTSPL